MEYALYSLAAYLLICKAWPYFLYPNYFRKSKVETYPELRELASRLKGADAFQTLQNVNAYMRETYSGSGNELHVGNLLSVFEIGDFSTRNILNRKRFLWCHTQNRLFKSILLNTGQFEEGDIRIPRTFVRSIFLHQRLVVACDGRTITIDPFYGVFE